MSHLILLKERLAVCRVDPEAKNPPWVKEDGFIMMTRTPDEFTVVCDQKWVPDHVKSEKGWLALKVQGPLEFSQIGVLASIAVPLSQAGVSIFVISTYDTDYILFKESQLMQAKESLHKAGHIVDAG